MGVTFVTGMGTAEAIGYIAEVVGAIVGITELITDDPVSETTIYNFANDMWLGSGQYTYTSPLGVSSIETGTCIFNPNTLAPGKTVFSGPHVTVQAVMRSNAGGTSPYLLYNGNVAGLGGGGYYDFRFQVDGESLASMYNLASCVRSTSITSMKFTAKTGTMTNPGYSYPSGGQGAACITANGNSFNTILTNNANMHSQHPNVPYVPKGTYDFDGLRDAIINQVNLDFDLDIPLNTPDIPTLDDVLGNETNPPATGDGFQFDYNEVISPSELQDLLEQETYELDEIDTDMPMLPVLPPPSDIIPSDGNNDAFEAEVLALIPAVVTESYNGLATLGLLGVFTSTAIIALIIKIIHDKRGD